METPGKNIVLVGFMGVGKGRTARMLAKQTGKFAVDCDDLIESYAKLKVKKIFATSGESYFRNLEQHVADWLEKNVSDTIISTGGGFFKVNNIRAIGTVVYLHSPFAAILDSINSHPKAKKKIKKRPLLKDLEKAEALFDARLPQYREIADFEIQVNGKKFEDVAMEICKCVEHVNSL